jgi:glycosyltransferase involved in cell wall biosynthesis
MWLYNLAKASLLTVNKPIFYIPNLIDNTLYKPIEKSYAKHLLNVDPDDLILGFGAISIDSPYKGWLYLQEALALLANKLSKIKGISVLVFGSGYNKDVADSIPFKTKFLGRLRDDLSTAIVYNAIDIMITPSTAEAFGLVILEALSCGTPVVAFNVGGIPDLILHKINGYLAAYKDSKDLAVGIEYCVDNNIKGYPPEKFAKLNTITKHLQLYETIGISC